MWEDGEFPSSDCSRLVAQQRSAVARAADQRLRRTSAALQARHVDDTMMALEQLYVFFS